MLKKIKTVVNSLAVTLALVLTGGFVYGQVATAQSIQNGLCQGSDIKLSDGTDAGTTTCDELRDTSGDGKELNDLIADIVNIFSVIVAIIAVIMIIVGGFKYITSGGDSNKVGSAKNTILYAIIGLIIVALAQFIVKFVLAKSTDLTANPNPSP